jgi:hypothetical protein
MGHTVPADLSERFRPSVVCTPDVVGVSGCRTTSDEGNVSLRFFPGELAEWCRSPSWAPRILRGFFTMAIIPMAVPGAGEGCRKVAGRGSPSVYDALSCCVERFGYGEMERLSCLAERGVGGTCESTPARVADAPSYPFREGRIARYDSDRSGTESGVRDVLALAYGMCLADTVCDLHSGLTVHQKHQGGVSRTGPVPEKRSPARTAHPVTSGHGCAPAGGKRPFPPECHSKRVS